MLAGDAGCAVGSRRVNQNLEDLGFQGSWLLPAVEWDRRNSMPSPGNQTVVFRAEETKRLSEESRGSLVLGGPHGAPAASLLSFWALGVLAWFMYLVRGAGEIRQG